MNSAISRRLVFHGGIVILLGMLSGIPFAMALLGYLSTDPSHWRISHMEGLVNGLLMLAIASSGQYLYLSDKLSRLLFFSIVFTGYSNALYGWTRGLTGSAGLDFAPPLGNQLAALLGGLPIFTAFLAIGLLCFGALTKQR